MRLILRAWTINGTWNGNRASAAIRIGSGWSFHSRTMCTLAGNTARNSATAAAATAHAHARSARLARALRARDRQARHLLLVLLDVQRGRGSGTARALPPLLAGLGAAHCAPPSLADVVAELAGDLGR